MKGKNLFDIGKETEVTISYIENNDEHIIGIEINQYTLDKLNTKAIYGFKDCYNNRIPIIINNDLSNNEIKFNREKNNKSTEYVPYEVKNDRNN